MTTNQLENLSEQAQSFKETLEDFDDLMKLIPKSKTGQALDFGSRVEVNMRIMAKLLGGWREENLEKSGSEAAAIIAAIDVILPRPEKK